MEIAKELIDIFRNDLCKDQREIKIITNAPNSSTNKIMRKYNLSSEEFDDEKSVITFLRSRGIDGIPNILCTGTEILGGNKLHYLDIEYFDGIRVYNVLAYIRMIDPSEKDIYERAQKLRHNIIEKCLKRQMLIQNSLADWARENNKKEVYPQIKLYNIVHILASVMHLSVNYDKLNNELEFITQEFNKRATVPFRDSTTKNMVIYSPELYLGNFVDESSDTLAADDRRFLKFKQMLRDDSYLELVKKPIVDFDFSSCEHLTTPYDDPIGFSCHEITFNGIPESDMLIWDKIYNDKDKYGIAISFIIRFLRFGGRKLAYHIFHPNAYQYRFRYDNEKFYFKNLNSVVCHYANILDERTPEFKRFVESVANYEMNRVIDSEDEFENAFPNCNRKFYIDIFPY